MSQLFAFWDGAVSASDLRAGATGMIAVCAAIRTGELYGTVNGCGNKDVELPDDAGS